MGTAATHEQPQSRTTERFVGSDGRVLKVAVVRIEQVELEVFPGDVEDAFTVDDHPFAALPRGKIKRASK